MTFLVLASVGLEWTRAVLVVSGRPFSRALLGPTMAWLVPAAILFAKNGLTAKVAVSVLRTSFAAWTVVIIGFAALTSHAVAAALHAKGLTTLRSMRPSRIALLAPLGMMLMLAQAPIFVLFARAGLWGAGVLHVALCLAVELLIVRVRTLSLPSWARSRPGARHPVIAMCVYYMRTIWRREHASASLAGTAMALGAGALWLSFHNDPPRSALGRAMCVLPISLCVVASLLVRPLVREEAALRSLLRSTRTRAWVPALAMIAVVCVPNAAYASAATYGATEVHRASTAAGAAIFALAVALAIVAWARRHARTKKQDPAQFVAGAIGIAIASIIVGVIW